MFHIVLPVFGIMPFSLCIFLCFSHVCLLRRPVEAKPVQTQSISERDLGRARCLLWFGGQLWRQPQSTRVENIFLGFLFLSQLWLDMGGGGGIGVDMRASTETGMTMDTLRLCTLACSISPMILSTPEPGWSSSPNRAATGSTRCRRVAAAAVLPEADVPVMNKACPIIGGAVRRLHGHGMGLTKDRKGPCPRL